MKTQIYASPAVKGLNDFNFHPLEVVGRGSETQLLVGMKCVFKPRDGTHTLRVLPIHCGRETVPSVFKHQYLQMFRLKVNIYELFYPLQYTAFAHRDWLYHWS